MPRLATVLCAAAAVLWCAAAPTESVPSSLWRLRRSRPASWENQRLQSKIWDLVERGLLRESVAEAIIGLGLRNEMSTEMSMIQGNNPENFGNNNGYDVTSQMDGDSLGRQEVGRSNNLPGGSEDAFISFADSQDNEFDDLIQSDDPGCTSRHCSVDADCCASHTCEMGVCTPICQPVPAGRVCTHCPCEDGLECRIFHQEFVDDSSQICVSANTDGDRLCDENGDCNVGECCALQYIQVHSQGVALAATCKSMASHRDCDRAEMHSLLDLYIGYCPCQTQM